MWKRRSSLRFSGEIPSLDVGLSFFAEFSVEWQLLRRRSQRSPEAAVRVVVSDAARVASECSILEFVRAQDRVASELGRLQEDKHGEVKIVSASARLHVPVSLMEEVREQQAIVRREELEDQRLSHEIARLDKFRRTVLADPASAMSYWFMQHPDDIESNSYEKIKQLLDRISETDAEQSWRGAGEVLIEFARDLSRDDKMQLMRIIEAGMNRFGHPDNAQRFVEYLNPGVRSKSP